MNSKDFFVLLNKTDNDQYVIDLISEQYNVVFDNKIAKIVSLVNKNIFIGGEYRVLSLVEIMQADIELNVDFASMSLLPLFDCMDNDFIVYDYANDVWCKYNIIDKFMFEKKASLEEMIG